MALPERITKQWRNQYPSVVARRGTLHSSDLDQACKKMKWSEGMVAIQSALAAKRPGCDNAVDQFSFAYFLHVADFCRGCNFLADLLCRFAEHLSLCNTSTSDTESNGK